MFDPNETLATQRRLTAELIALLGLWNGNDIVAVNNVAHAAYELCEHTTALDESLTKGGTLPDAWAHAPDAGTVANWCKNKGLTLVVRPDAGATAPQMELRVYGHVSTILWQSTGDSVDALIACAMRDLP